MNRNLDGCFFRVQRDGKWQNICFSDLSNAERDQICHGKSKEFLQSLCLHLADVIREIGEEFDIVKEL